MTKIMTSTLLSLALVSTTMAYAQESSDWKHSISVYGWLPSFDGTFKYKIPGDTPGDPDEEGESSALDNLDMVFMGSYEVRKEKWSFLADMIYLKMSADQEVYLPRLDVLVNSEQEFIAWMLGFYGGYNTLNSDKATLDVIMGMRYFSLGLDASLTVNNRQVGISPSIEFYDAVIGVKGDYNFNKNWYLPYQFDIGGGDSDLTWQAQASVGYKFDWGDILLTYRYIHYDKSDSGLINDFDMYGPKLGVVFHF